MRPAPSSSSPAAWVMTTEALKDAPGLEAWRTAFQGIMAVSWEPLLLVTCASRRVVDANPAACRLYGLSRSSLTERDFADLFSDRRHLADIFATHRDFVPLRFQRAAEDRHIPVEMSFNYFRVEGEEYAAVAIRDITERLSRQREETEGEQKYQSLFEASPYPILMLSSLGVIVDANRCALVCYGYDRAELSGKEWSVLETVPASHSFLVRPSMLPPAEHRRKDGSSFMAEVALSYFRLRNQTMVLALIRDVTEHWRTFQQLQESEARWRFAIEGNGDALIDWPLEPDSRPYLSATLSQMLGYDPDEDQHLDKQAWRNRVHPDDLRNLTATVFGRLEGATGIVQTEGRLRTRDGSYRWVALRAKLIDMAGGGRRLIGALSDIHEEHLKEQQQAANREKLFRLERLATIGEMLSVLAHEINQPLAAIANYSSIGIHQLSGKGTRLDAKTSLSKINVQALRAGEIVRRIRNFVRRSEPEYALTDLNALIRRVAGWSERQATTAGITLIMELESALPELELDVLQIEQLMFNLIRNGLEAMQDEALCQPRLLEVGTLVKGATVEVAVRDHGVGMPETQGNSVFDPFVSTKPDGMGMGLAICRTIIENHGGALWFETVANERGTRFAFTLNLTRDIPPDIPENGHDSLG